MSKDTTDTEIDPKLLLEVLQNQTTLNNVKTLLQSKNVPHSASSWSNMIEERIQPAIADGTLVFDDLVNLVRDAEEHGRKHVRLFRFNEATPGELSSALDAQTVGAWAEARNYPAAGQYVFSAYPAAPFISEVRLGDIGDPNALVIKVARTEYRRKTGELQEFNGEEVIISRRVPFRAVDVLKERLKNLAC